MIDLQVCVGSSCHMKGSYQVIKTFERLIKENELESKIKLKACFCLGRCMSGISVMLGDLPIENVGFSNAELIFYDTVMPYIEKTGE